MLEEINGIEVAASRIAPDKIKFWETTIGRPVGSVIDVGCGSGGYWKAMEKAGIQWRGVDVNEEMVSFAQTRGAPVELGNFAEFGFVEEFDVVFFSQVLEHVLEPLPFMAAVATALRPGGIVHLDVPNHSSLTSVIRKLNPGSPDYGFLQPPNHLVAYTRPSLEWLIAESGLEVVSVSAEPNDHRVFGQALPKIGAASRFVYRMSGLMGRGSLLVGIAKKTE